MPCLLLFPSTALVLPLLRNPGSGIEGRLVVLLSPLSRGEVVSVVLERRGP